MEVSAPNIRRRTTPDNFFDGDDTHFIKVILEDELRNKILKIPRLFVDRHPGTLSDPVRIEVPTGRVWEVGLRRDNGGLYLHDGWAAFLKDCSVGLGYLLLFRYQGDSKFFVAVFDLTTCEIDYPDHRDVSTRIGSAIIPWVSPPGMGKADMKAAKIEESNDLHSLGKRAKHGRKKPLLCSNRPPKRLRTRQQSNEVPTNVSDCSLPETRPLTLANEADSRMNPGVRRPAEFCGNVTVAEKSEAYIRASSFLCENRACVVRIRCLGCLHMSKKFLMACFPGRSEFGDIVCVSKRKSWTLGINKSQCPRFRHGWTGFVRDNNLRVGDACVFELMDRSEAKFRVFIFQDECTALPCSSPQKNLLCRETSTGELSSQTDSQRVNASVKMGYTDGVGEEHPFFPVVITKTSARHSVHVPATFAKRHLPEIKAMENVKASLEYEGLTWPVALYSRIVCSSVYTMMKGWQAFRKGNGFQVGDELRFELVDRNELVFRVSVSNDSCSC